MDHPPCDPHDTTPAGGDDPVVEACLADALGPYLGALSPEEVDEYRRLLTVFITTHPAATPLYERLRARPHVVSESGEVARAGAEGAGAEGAGAEELEDRRSSGTFGGRR